MENTPYFKNIVHRLNEDGMPLDQATKTARRIVQLMTDSVSFRAEMKETLKQEIIDEYNDN